MNRLYTLLIASISAITAMAAVPGPYINPEGEAKSYKCDTEGFIVFWGEVGTRDGSYASQVVYADNGDVYFKAVPAMEAPGMVKGTIHDGKVVVELPQCVGTIKDSYTGRNIDLYVNMLECVWDETGYFYYYNVDEPNTTVEYTLADDGSFVLDLGDANPESYLPDHILGVVSDLDPQAQAWMGYGDWKETFTPFDKEPVTLPEGLKSETWTLFYEYEGRNVQIAVDGDDIYLGDLTDELPGSYVKGKIEGNYASFPLTYLGYSEIAENFVYFVPCEYEEFTFEDGGEVYEDYIIKPAFEFAYDPEEKTLENLVEYAAIFIGTSDRIGGLAGSYIEYFYEPEIVWVDPANADAPMQDPEFYAAYNFRDWDDCDLVEFILPSFNSAGYLLDTKNLYYIFYIDGKPLTLTPEVYIGLDEDMTEIPYEFSDYVNQDVWCYGQEHQISVFAEHYSTVGLKMVYYKPDGEKIESNYVEANIEELSGGEIEAGVIATVAEQTVVGVEYYDLQGRLVANPQPGLYVRSTVYADGSRQVQKVAIK